MNIIDPISNKEYDLFSDVGKNLLKMYVNKLMTGGSRKGGNPKGRGGGGKTYRHKPSTKASSKSRQGIKSSKIQIKTQQAQNDLRRRAQETFIKRKLKQIEKEMEDPLYEDSFRNGNSFIKNIENNHIKPKELINIKYKLKLTEKDKEYINMIEEDENYINMMLKQQIELSTYTAVSAFKQTQIGLAGLMNPKKPLWERMVFAILFLSLFRSIAEKVIDPQTNLPITAGFTEFGGYSYDYFKMIDKEREKIDNEAAAAAAADNILTKKKGIIITANEYLKSVPTDVIDKIQEISGKIDNLGENKQLYIKGIMLVILGIVMYHMGLYKVPSGRYLI